MARNYRYDWLSPRSGFEFRLEFFFGNDFLKDFNDVIALPAGTVDLLNAEAYDYDTIPTKFGKSPVAKLHIELKYLTSWEFEEFVTMILDPPRDATTFVEFDADGVSHSLSIKCGTIIQLHVKAHGKDATSPVPWRLLKRFVHRDGIDVEDIWDVITDEVDFKIEDMNKFILDQVNFGLLKERSYFKGPYWNYTYSYNLFDIVQRNTSLLWGWLGNFALGQQSELRNQVFIFAPYRDIFYYLKTYAQQIYCTLLGDWTAVYTLDFPEKRFYKQKYDQTGGIGAELSAADIYRIVQVRKDDKITDGGGYNQVFDKVIVGGLYTDLDENSYENMYKSAWDYISDYYEEHSCKAIYLQNGVTFSEVFSSGGYMNTGNFELAGKLILSKVDIKPALVAKTTSSLFEFTDDDISNFVENAPGNRNGQEKLIPISENNMPVNAKFKTNSQNTDVDWCELSGFFIFAIQNSWHIQTLYYFENASPMIKAGASAPIRVHERVDYLMRSATGANVWNTPPSTIDYSTYFTADALQTSKIQETILSLVTKIQETGLCIHGVAAKKLMEAFGDYPEQFPARSMEIEVDFVDLTNMSDNMPYSFAGLDPRALIDFSLHSVNNRITTATSDWLILKSEIDFMSETVKLKVINRKNL